MFEFLCEFCGWEGTEPAFDPHLTPFCPRCGKPAEFKAVAMKRRGASTGRDDARTP